MESPAEGHHQVYEFSSFTLDPSTRMLLRGTLPIPLPPKVFDTLLYMVQNPDRVLGKDEMMAAIWPDRVLEEGNLSQNIFTLRKALKDGDKVRSIVTAPGRGYRFTASIRRISRRTTQPQSVAEVATRPGPTLPDAPAPSAARAVGVSSNPAFRNVALTVGSLLLVVGGLVYSVGHWPRNGPTTERSRILLTGIANLTDDAAFNTVPGNVLEISLSQSPFLSLIPSQQVGKTLQLMERPADTKLSAELAQEVCLRNQGKAMLSGAIAAFGSHYVVTFEASDCASGERIVQSKVEANRKEDVPRAIDRLISSMRTRLGESLSSVRQFGIPIEQATTASFEGLKAFSAGEQSRYQGDNAAAVPLFKRAVELDPSFALAYAELAGAYVGLREPETARIYYQMAFEHRDRASEMERLWISAEYLKLTGDLSESINSYRALASLYPTDGRPWESLADLYTRLARYQDAVEAARVGLRLNPEDSRAYIVLARAYKRSNRFDEANAIGDQATAKGLDGWPMHCLLYEVAFALGDVGKMSEQIMKETGKPGEGWIVEYEALGAATAGKLKQSRAMFERSIALTEAGGGEDRRATVSNFYVDYISMLAQFGLYQEARRLVSRTRGVEENDEGPYALAQIGELERAAELDREFGRRFPDSTLLNGFTRPRTQAAIALGQRRPRDALAALQPALAAKLRTFDVPLLLGRAHLDLKEPVEAATDFQEILENRGVDGVSPAYPLAYLGLARAMRMHGNVQKSRAAYERLFAFWKDADPDNPVLVRARREYAALGYSASAPGL